MKRLAGDEDAVVRIERIAEVLEVEVAVRSVHVGVRHADAADRVRPPGILADGEHPPPLLYLLGVVMQEPSEIPRIHEGVAGGHQARRGLLARLAVEVGLDPHVHGPNAGPRELEALGGDVLVDVPEV